MPFPNDVASLIDFLGKLPQQKIARVLSALMLIYIAYQAAQLTWLMIPQEKQSYHPSGYGYNPNSGEVDIRVNIETLSALNLFGSHEAPSVEEAVVQVDAPETKLQLTLAGVVASDDTSVSAAIIENKGTQETYGVGDMITGTRVVLDNVLSDRVILKVSGRLETLMLDGFDYKKSDFIAANKKKNSAKPKVASKSKNKLIDQRNNQTLTKQAASLKNDLATDPGKITDYLKIVPKRKKGKIIGYRLMAGKKKDFFKASGLKSGDVAIQMNGYDLVEPMQAAQALQALKTEQEVSLLIDRNGEMTEILFSIN